jgi:methylated-DNA-[protein]-cysteine S-methyltransferase
MTLQLATMDSPVGELRVIASAAGLVAVLWEREEVNRVRFSEPMEILDEPSGVSAAAVEQLREYFAATRQEFDVPLDPRGTVFQVKAWRALATIPYGRTASYREQAVLVGSPTAVRAVGAANGKNPLSIVLPCHRVIGSNGSLTGFAGGLDAKRALLEFELRVSMGDTAAMPTLDYPSGRAGQRL